MLFLSERLQNEKNNDVEINNNIIADGMRKRDFTLLKKDLFDVFMTVH